MRVITGRSTRAVAVAAVLAVALGAGSAGAAAAPATTPTDPVVTAPLATVTGDEITFTGHGWGHGRGMGQYGALGFAVDHGWDYRTILGRYYSNTTVGNVGNPLIDVELVTPSTRTWTIVAGNGLLVNGADIGGAGLDVVLVQRSGTSYTVSRGTSCESATWTPIGTYSGYVELAVPTQSGYENLVRSCEAGNTMRAYRGSMAVTAYGAAAGDRILAANRVNLENYLLGVVPRESPDSWGSLPNGMEALKAQTVAARSYAMASSRSSGAKTCDTTTCQVYGGAAELAWNGSGYVVTKTLDGANTNAAIAATTGEVRMLGSAVARTEFSSSTGGYTAGGTFPAVLDEGDAISANPNHTWTTTLSAAAIATKLGVAGPISGIQVTARNGLGDWGGRATQLRVVDANGVAHLWNGSETIRTTLGLKSDWFTISGGGSAEAEQVVRALYADVLGRGVDPSGMATWTAYIERTQDPAGLARQIVTSRERMENLVAAQYLLALNRAPEPEGLDHWVAWLAAGRGVYDLQIGIYGSPESLQALGGGDVSTWVGGLYDRILGRGSDASERAFWTGIAARQGRPAVVAAIARSEEATMRRLTVYYQTFLLRGVDASGKATFLPLMTGRGDFDIPIAIASSPEYWARAQTRSY